MPDTQEIAGNARYRMKRHADACEMYHRNATFYREIADKMTQWANEERDKEKECAAILEKAGKP